MIPRDVRGEKAHWLVVLTLTVLLGTAFILSTLSTPYALHGIGPWAGPSSLVISSREAPNHSPSGLHGARALAARIEARPLGGPTNISRPENVSITVGNGATQAFLDTSNGIVYIPNYFSGNISMINGTGYRVAGSIPGWLFLMGGTYDNLNGYLYILCNFNDTVMVINATSDKFVTSVAVAGGPYAAVFNPSNGMIYVADGQSGQVSVINGSTNKVVATISVGGYAENLAVDSSTSSILVTTGIADEVAIINESSNQVLRDVKVGAFPETIIDIASLNEICVANTGGYNVTVLNASTYKPIVNISMSVSPAGLAYDAARKLLFVADSSLSKITLVNASSGAIVGTIGLNGMDPYDLLYDSQSDAVFVGYSNGGVVTILVPGIGVTLNGTPNPTDLGVGVTLTASVRGGLPPYVAYAWSFGDGQEANTTGSSLFHTFSRPGVYNLTLSVNDSDGFRGSTNLTVAVEPDPLAGPVSSLNATIDAGENATLVASARFGVAPFAYAWTGLPAGCPGVHSATVTCMWPTSGTWPVRVTVTDAVGETSPPGPLLEFSVLPDPTVGQIIANRTSADIGQLVGLTANVSAGGGVYPPYYWSGLGGANCNRSEGPQLSCAFVQPGNYSISAFSVDSSGVKTDLSAPLDFQVFSLPVVSPPTISRESADVHQVVVFSASVIGGSGAYLFSWEGLPTGCPVLALSIVSCTMSAPGSFTVGLTVVDGNGARSFATSSASLTVYSDLLVLAPHLSTASIHVGGNLTIVAPVAGGAGGDSFSWSGLPPGCEGLTATIQCSPTTAGTFPISVSVKDSDGFEVHSGNSTLVVTPLPASRSSTLGLSRADGYGILGGIVVAAIGVSLGLASRKRARHR